MPQPPRVLIDRLNSRTSIAARYLRIALFNLTLICLLTATALEPSTPVFSMPTSYAFEDTLTENPSPTSPIISYGLAESFNAVPEQSRLVSYQYFESAGDDVLNLANSFAISYWFQPR